MVKWSLHRKTETPGINALYMAIFEKDGKKKKGILYNVKWKNF